MLQASVIHLNISNNGVNDHIVHNVLICSIVADIQMDRIIVTS